MANQILPFNNLTRSMKGLFTRAEDTVVPENVEKSMPAADIDGLFQHSEAILRVEATVPAATDIAERPLYICKRPCVLVRAPWSGVTSIAGAAATFKMTVAVRRAGAYGVAVTVLEWTPDASGDGDTTAFEPRDLTIPLGTAIVVDRTKFTFFAGDEITVKTTTVGLGQAIPIGILQIDVQDLSDTESV